MLPADANYTTSKEPPGPIGSLSTSLSTQRKMEVFNSFPPASNASGLLFHSGIFIYRTFPNYCQYDHFAEDILMIQITHIFDLAQDFDLNVSVVHVTTLIQVFQIMHLLQKVEQTPKDEQTAAQVYFLKHCRYPAGERHTSTTIEPSPSSSSSRSRPSSCSPSPSILRPSSPLPLPLFSTSQQIFVDASGSGIGFCFGERWLAWIFKRPRFNRNIPTDRNRRIIISWAELIAVELGVLTLISAGYVDTSIIVRSDNLGVVVALERGAWKTEFGLQDVLERILEMCHGFRLELRMKWIESKDNPADGPSRRVYPSRKMMFGSSPVIPDHLSSVLQEA